MNSAKTFITVGIVLGLLLTLGGLRLDGFVGGACQGAGVALVLLGVYLLGAHGRGTRGDISGTEAEQWWLPSRDGRR